LQVLKTGERLNLQDLPEYKEQQGQLLEQHQEQLKQQQHMVPKFNRPHAARAHPPLVHHKSTMFSTVDIWGLKDRHYELNPDLNRDDAKAKVLPLRLIFDGDWPMFKFRLASHNATQCLQALLHFSCQLNYFGILPVFVLGTKSSLMKRDEQMKRLQARNGRGVKLLDRPSRDLLEEAARISTSSIDGSSIGFQVHFATEGLEAERVALSILKEGSKVKIGNDMIYALVSNDADAAAMSGSLFPPPDILYEYFFKSTIPATDDASTCNETNETNETTTTSSSTSTTSTTTTSSSTTSTTTSSSSSTSTSNKRSTDKTSQVASIAKKLKNDNTTPPTATPVIHQDKKRRIDIPDQLTTPTTPPTTPSTTPLTTPPTTPSTTPLTTTLTPTPTPTPIVPTTIPPTTRRNFVFKRVNLNSFKKVYSLQSVIALYKNIYAHNKKRVFIEIYIFACMPWIISNGLNPS
jgi:hypothetical protein